MKAIGVIVVGQTPPPVHGQALSIQQLVRARFDRITVHHVPMDFSVDVGEIGRVRLRKLWRLVRLIWRVLRVRFTTDARVLYYPPAGPMLVPVLRDILFLATVRHFFPTLVLSFHASGVQDMEPRLPRPVRPLFRLAYYDAELAIHKYPPEWNNRVLPAQRNVVVPSGIEDAFPAFETVVRKRPGFTMLYVGILTPTKGIWDLLDSASELRARGVNVQAVLVGEFDSVRTETEWNKRVETAGMGEYVRLTGQLLGEAKWLEFHHADVFCFPTHYVNEALPRVVIEAMQFALPVVASAWRGIPSLVHDGVTGFLVPPRDTAALTDRLEQLAGDSSMRANMAASARRTYLERFTLEAHLSAMEEALLTAASAGSGGRGS
jgi:glycosyltransferase involved in cell wall biosynthesis